MIIVIEYGLRLHDQTYQLISLLFLSPKSSPYQFTNNVKLKQYFPFRM